MEASDPVRSASVLMQARTPDSTRIIVLIKFLIGSNVIVAGTAIFGAAEPEKVISMLKSTVDTAQAKLAEQRK